MTHAELVHVIREQAAELRQLRARTSSDGSEQDPKSSPAYRLIRSRLPTLTSPSAGSMCVAERKYL